MTETLLCRSEFESYLPRMFAWQTAVGIMVICKARQLADGQRTSFVRGLSYTFTFSSPFIPFFRFFAPSYAPFPSFPLFVFAPCPFYSLHSFLIFFCIFPLLFLPNSLHSFFHPIHCCFRNTPIHKLRWCLRRSK